MTGKRYGVAAAVLLGLMASPLAAQISSESQKFLSAVRDRDGHTATESLRLGRASLINARDDKGQTALMITIARRDEDWSLFLLSKGADVNAGTLKGDTPLIAAARIGFASIASELLVRKAKVDATNRMGETPLIVAVQQRHIPIVKMLLAAGADPDKADSAAGFSARDYARRDTRSREILKLIESRKPKA